MVLAEREEEMVLAEQGPMVCAAQVEEVVFSQLGVVVLSLRLKRLALGQYFLQSCGDSQLKE